LGEEEQEEEEGFKAKAANEVDSVHGRGTPT